MDEDIPNPYDEAFEMPEKVLDQVSECSPEGFLLFVINEQGEVELYNKFSADIIEAGLRAKALKILNSLNAVEDSEMTSQIMHLRNQENEEGEEDQKDF